MMQQQVVAIDYGDMPGTTLVWCNRCKRQVDLVKLQPEFEVKVVSDGRMEQRTQTGRAFLTMTVECHGESYVVRGERWLSKTN